MFQFPMLGSSLAGSARGVTPDTAPPGQGLRGLLQGVDGESAGFSGELQAMLMQLTPAMLQRLDELLAGGTALPQAARAVLQEFAADPGDPVFPDLLRQLAAVGDRAAVVPTTLQPEAAAVPRTAAHAVPGVVVAQLTVDPAAPGGQGQPPTLGLPAQGATAMPSSLSSQLAGSLLDMGVPQQVNSRSWPDAVAERVAWMLQGDQQFARLKLNPPNLGPLEVRVSVNQDQTQVAFLAHHAVVREALEAALPRLREMFDQSSLQLVRADVSDPGAGHGEATDGTPRRAGGHAGWDADEAMESLQGGADHVATSGVGLVDLFV